MKKWSGSAGICVKEQKLLMVLQGKIDEPKRWSVPSGGLLAGESFEACCIRELKEETGYEIKINRPLFKKETEYLEVQYFEIAIIGGKAEIRDPDHLIYEIAWKSIEEISSLDLSFPEDEEFLIQYLQKS